MSVRIVTDSSSDITQTEARALGITVVPLKVIFDGVEYRDGVDITNEEFYQKLKKSKNLPTTTQPSSMDFQEAFEEASEDEIVAVLLASQLSGTVQSAMIARESAAGKNIFIVDSLTATLKLRIGRNRTDTQLSTESKLLDIPDSPTGPLSGGSPETRTRNPRRRKLLSLPHAGKPGLHRHHQRAPARPSQGLHRGCRGQRRAVAAVPR